MSPSTPEHERLYEAASNAINLLFSDNTVDAVQTRESLEELKGEITIMIQALGEDLEDEAQAPDEADLIEDEEPDEDA